MVLISHADLHRSHYITRISWKTQTSFCEKHAVFARFDDFWIETASLSVIYFHDKQPKSDTHLQRSESDAALCPHHGEHLLTQLLILPWPTKITNLAGPMQNFFGQLHANIY
jgi:hypothetical protein